MTTCNTDRLALCCDYQPIHGKHFHLIRPAGCSSAAESAHDAEWAVHQFGHPRNRKHGDNMGWFILVAGTCYECGFEPWIRRLAAPESFCCQGLEPCNLCPDLPLRMLWTSWSCSGWVWISFQVDSYLSLLFVKTLLPGVTPDPSQPHHRRCVAGTACRLAEVQISDNLNWWLASKLSSQQQKAKESHYSSVHHYLHFTLVLTPPIEHVRSLGTVYATVVAPDNTKIVDCNRGPSS